MYFFVFTTTNNKRIAKIISEEILKSGLSPCVQTDENISTIYKWENRIENIFEEIDQVEEEPWRPDFNERVSLLMHKMETLLKRMCTE